MANEDFKTIGAGWKKTSKAGNSYLSLVFDQEAIGNHSLGDLNIMVFEVKKKSGPKGPDYSVSATLKETKKQAAAPLKAAPQIPQARPAVKNYAPPEPKEVDVEPTEKDWDEVPF